MPNPTFSFTFVQAQVKPPSPNTGVNPMVGWFNAGWFIGLAVSSGSQLSYPLPAENQANTMIVTQRSTYGVYYSVSNGIASVLANDPLSGLPVNIGSQSFPAGNYSLVLTINSDGTLTAAPA